MVVSLSDDYASFLKHARIFAKCFFILVWSVQSTSRNCSSSAQKMYSTRSSGGSGSRGKGMRKLGAGLPAQCQDGASRGSGGS